MPSIVAPSNVPQTSSLFFDTHSSIGTHDATLRASLSTLITASHILHHHSILDAYGHISLRNPSNPSTFFLPRNLAPALIRSGDDLVEYHISDASPVLGSQAPHGYVERAIHAAVLKRWPGANAVLHAHDEEIMPWTLVVSEDDSEEEAKKEHGLAAVSHMAGFLGTGVPVWDIAHAYDERAAASGHEVGARDMLVRDVALGASLAKAFGRGNIAGAGGPNAPATPTRSGAPSGTVSPTSVSSPSSHSLSTAPALPKAASLPPHSVVLMRGHGYTSLAPTLEILVHHAIYMRSNARIQARASALACESGKGKNKIAFLTEQEARDASKISENSWERAWALWEREVKVNPLYENALKWEDEEEDEADKRRRDALHRSGYGSTGGYTGANGVVYGGGKRDSVASIHSTRGHGHSNLHPVVARAMEKEKEEAASAPASRRGSILPSWADKLLGD